MDPASLKSMGTRLVNAYYKHGLTEFKKEIRLSLMWLAQFKKDSYAQKFHIVDALLAYAEKPGNASYDVVIPILHEFLRLNPEIKKAWRKTAEAFLTNRIIGRGNIPFFKVRSAEEYLLLRDDLAGLLDIVPRDNIILAHALHYFFHNGLKTPKWLLELAQFSPFQLKILKSHAPGSTIKKENYGFREIQELDHIGIRVITPQVVAEDYLSYEYDWHASV